MKLVHKMGIILGIFVFANVARADHLDEELIKHSKKIMTHFRDKGYKNVGILKFTVEGVEGYNAGLINANLANRLENALILANDVDQPIGITRKAGAVAAQAVARKEIWSPTTAEARKALFKLKYPLAWGADKVEVDAFVTGTVVWHASGKKIVVTVQDFDRKGNLNPIATIPVPMDRSILSDLGQSFFIRRSVNDTDDTQEKEAIESAASIEKQKPAKVEANKTPVSDIVELKAYYNGKQVEFENNPDRPGTFKLKEPSDKQKIHFTIKNKSDKRVAVALRVNGQNTTADDEENLQPAEYTKWVLDPGTEYAIRGFYSKDGKTVKAFSVVADDALDITLNPATRGLIQLDVFAESKNAPSADGISLRANAEPGKMPATLAEARKEVMLATVNRKVLPSSKGLIAPGAADVTDVQAVTFTNPAHVGSLVIRYYSKPR